MAVLGVVLFFVAVTGTLVSGDKIFDFAENVRGDSRIVSGWEAADGDIPWQISLRMVSALGAVSACGGSVVHPEWAITAAHCTAGRISFVLRFGGVDLSLPLLLLETTVFFNHPAYNNDLASVVQPNDIGLLKFKRVVPFSDRIKPINIQLSGDKDRNYNGVKLMASGWGRTWTNGESPTILNWVYLVGDSNLVCSLSFGGSSIIQDSTICASHYNITSQSTCQGDSGGPLVAYNENTGKPTLVGVSSFVSSAGCHAPLPAGFIRPGHYHDWYYEVTGINFDIEDAWAQ